jgi:AcrR family transcriptional regulator
LKLPRTREFDEAAALEATMRRFGAGGFATTAVRDLGDAIGLGQASVYNALAANGRSSLNASIAIWTPI